MKTKGHPLAETAKIYKKYKELFGQEMLELVKTESQKTKDPKRKEILERIYFTLAGSFVGQQLADEEDKITTYFTKAKVRVRGEELVYFQIAPLISKEPQFGQREFLDGAATPVVAKINPKQLVLLSDEIKLFKSLGFGGYLDFYSQAKKMDYVRFAVVARKLEAETEKIWLAAIGRVCQEVLGRPFKNIRACHLLYLRSLSMFDNYFPKDKVVATFEKWSRDMGLSDLLSVVKIDDVDRPRKNPRAVCYPSNPPEEVHLVIKPIGGEQDYEAMFHEGGHSLHFAGVDSRLPYTFRNLARSNALTEALAFILEDLVFNPLFLTTYLNVSAFTGAKIKWQACFVNLMLLRRYLGKFSYELAMFKRNALGHGPILYKKHLEETTGFIHKRENWLSDMDSGFYSAEYLRAWIAAAQIQDYLLKKFGMKWFVNRRAGEFLRKLYSRGVQDEVEDVVKRLGYRPWDAKLLVAGYRQVLG
ncbi:hypothetical protein HYZ70_00765 [Candidatus Curtissbacteria bacterium]|nr:hypothetical protein [Candidatus Curtissbacteria bacterium]